MSLRALTPAEVQANRAAAASTIKLRLGLPASPSSWTWEQAQQYKAELAAYIAARPAEFPTAQDQKTAALVLANPHTPPEDASFDWAMFGAEYVKPVASIGEGTASALEGVAAALKSTKWLIPLALVAVVVIGLFAFANRTGARRAAAA